MKLQLSSSSNLKPFNQPKQKGNSFSDNCTDGLYSWVIQSSSGTWTSTRNGFEYAGDAAAAAKIYLPNFSCKNGIIEAEVLANDFAANRFMGIMLRNNNTGSGGYLFRLQIVASVTSWEAEVQASTFFGQVNYTWIANRWYKIGLSVIGTKIEAYIGGIKVLSTNDSSVTGLSPALFSSGSSPCKFRNIRILST